MIADSVFAAALRTFQLISSSSLYSSALSLHAKKQHLSSSQPNLHLRLLSLTVRKLLDLPLQFIPERKMRKHNFLWKVRLTRPLLPRHPYPHRDLRPYHPWSWDRSWDIPKRGPKSCLCARRRSEGTVAQNFLEPAGAQDHQFALMVVKRLIATIQRSLDNVLRF